MAGNQGTATRNDPHEALASVIEAERRDMHTTAVGEVVSYNPATQRAVIKPRLKQKFGDTVLDAPELQDVPVSHPRGGGMVMHAPLKAGDEVTLQFMQRSMDGAAEDGGAMDGFPGRMNSLSDAVATPASYSKGAALSGMPADKAHIGSQDGKSGLQVDPATGKLDIVMNGDSFMAVLVDALNIIKSHKNNGAPMDAGDQAALQAVIDRATAIRI